MKKPQLTGDSIDRAARAIRAADAILIGAGAGMGVDSGLPDFRGKEGFWRAYPPYQRLGLEFVSLASPRWFAEDPTFAWGFYGHRLQLYRRTVPHEGFSILRRWLLAAECGGFVFTSNVDGHFQSAGFAPERLVEIHGSFSGMQCTNDCGIGIVEPGTIELTIDEETMRAVPPLPSCPRCGALARPNILMFGDWSWDSAWTDAQIRRMDQWIESLSGAHLVLIECGAGGAIPTVRATCERLAHRLGGTLIRINPREPDVPPGHVSIPAPALATLRALDERLQSAAR